MVERKNGEKKRKKKKNQNANMYISANK